MKRKDFPMEWDTVVCVRDCDAAIAVIWLGILAHIDLYVAGYSMCTSEFPETECNDVDEWFDVVVHVRKSVDIFIANNSFNCCNQKNDRKARPVLRQHRLEFQNEIQEETKNLLTFIVIVFFVFLIDNFVGYRATAFVHLDVDLDGCRVRRRNRHTVIHTLMSTKWAWIKALSFRTNTTQMAHTE